MNKPLLLIIFISLIAGGWACFKYKDNLSVWLDEARDFGSFGGDDEDGQLPAINITPDQVDHNNTGNGSPQSTSGLRVGSILKLRLQPLAPIDLNRTDTNGTLEFEARVLGISPPSEPQEEGNGSK